MAKARRRNRRRLQSWRAWYKTPRRRVKPRRTVLYYPGYDPVTGCWRKSTREITVVLRAHTEGFHYAIEQVSAIERVRTAMARIQEHVAMELEEATACEINQLYMQNPDDSSLEVTWDAGIFRLHEDDATESADILSEVEAQETLEEKGILPPLEDSMQRWQELIDEYQRDNNR